MLKRKHFNSFKNLKDNNSVRMRNIIKNVDIKSEFFLKENFRFRGNFEKKERKRVNDKKRKKNISLTKKMIFEKRNQNKYYSQIIEKDKKRKNDFKRKILNKIKNGYDSQLMAMNPITLQYYNNRKGKLLKEKHKYIEIRKMIKSKNHEYQNLHAFNIINGLGHKNLINLPISVLQKYKEQLKPRKHLSTYRSYKV